jgi:hypothetical protein
MDGSLEAPPCRHAPVKSKEVNHEPPVGASDGKNPRRAVAIGVKKVFNIGLPLR